MYFLTFFFFFTLSVVSQHGLWPAAGAAPPLGARGSCSASPVFHSRSGIQYFCFIVVLFLRSFVFQQVESQRVFSPQVSFAKGVLWSESKCKVSSERSAAAAPTFGFHDNDART